MESSSLTISLYAVDRSGYTKADAINKQWKKNGMVDTSNKTLNTED